MKRKRIGNVVPLFSTDQELVIVARAFHQILTEAGKNWLHFAALANSPAMDDLMGFPYTAAQKRQLVRLVRAMFEQTPWVPPDAA